MYGSGGRGGQVVTLADFGHAQPVARSRLALGLVAVFTATSLFALGSVSGLSYLWCAPMGEARLHCCCPEDEDARAHATVRPLCCESRELAELPSARLDPSVDLVLASGPEIPALLVSPPRIEAETRVLALAPAARPVVRARGSPGRRVHSDCSVYLL